MTLARVSATYKGNEAMDMAAGLDIDGGRAGFRALRIISPQQRFYRHENAAKEAAAQINIVATIDEFYSTVALL